MNPSAASYDLSLVILSYVISVFGAYAALQLAVAIPTARGRALWGWLLGAAFAMGGGAIWSMHFIAMLAYRMPMPVRYDSGLTLASLAVAILVTGIGLYIVGRGEASAVRLVGGGLFTGLGVAAINWQMFGSAFVMGAAVCGMHYTGMAAAIITPGKLAAPSPAIAMGAGDLAVSVFVITAILLTIALIVAHRRSARDLLYEG